MFNNRLQTIKMRFREEFKKTDKTYEEVSELLGIKKGRLIYIFHRSGEPTEEEIERIEELFNTKLYTR